MKQISDIKIASSDELDEDAHRYSTFSAHSSLSYLSNIKF